MSPRDAAVAAALAGAVVVVLGYASGVGIRVPDAIAVQPPAQPSAPAVSTPAQPEPVMTIPEMPAMQMPAMPPMSMPGGHPTHPDPTPTEPATPDPTPGPTPEPEEPTCAPALLEALPVVGEATAPVRSLISGVLGSTPVLDELAGPAKPGKKPGLLTCVVGAVVGPNCCGPTSGRRGGAGR